MFMCSVPTVGDSKQKFSQPNKSSPRIISESKRKNTNIEYPWRWLLLQGFLKSCKCVGISIGLPKSTCFVSTPSALRICTIVLETHCRMLFPNAWLPDSQFNDSHWSSWFNTCSNLKIQRGQFNSFF